jgi:hypothetical protein
LQGEKTRQEKARKILDHLVRRPSSEFDKFYQCLIDSDNTDLADKLRPECAPCRRVSKPRKPTAPASTLSSPIQPADKGGKVGFPEPVPRPAEESLIEQDELPESMDHERL